MKFAKTLKKLRNKAKLTRYALARDSGVDPPYLARLERGEKVRPGRPLVLRIGQALLDNSGKISLKDVDRLLQAAGYEPLPRNHVLILPPRRKDSPSAFLNDISRLSPASLSFSRIRDLYHPSCDSPVSHLPRVQSGTKS